MIEKPNTFPNVSQNVWFLAVYNVSIMENHANLSKYPTSTISSLINFKEY